MRSGDDVMVEILGILCGELVRFVIGHDNYL